MAAPARPSVIIEGELLRYQSLDNVDQTLYDGLPTQYQRTAFLVAVQDELGRIASGAHPAFMDGDAIAAEWHRRRTYLIGKWKEKTPRHRPNPAAEPPLPVVHVQQPAAPAAQLLPPPLPAVQDLLVQGPPIQTPPVQPPSSQSPPAQPSTVQPPPAQSPTVQSPADASPVTFGSADTLAGGSLPFILLTTREHEILPTRGQIAHVREDMKEQGWKFVRVLYQSNIESNQDEDGPGDLYSFKSVFLYVRSDENGQIVDRLVVKCININHINTKFKKTIAENEIEMNMRLKRLRCSHVLKCRGHGERKTRKRTIPWEEGRQDEQRVLHLYTEFARYGDLSDIIKAHAKAKRPVPEHFVWHYLDQMTHALLTLQDGICRQPHDLEPAVVEGDDVGAARSWASLLYGDIKPHNIFCAEGNEPYPSYPRVLLADFDSVQKSDKDPGRHAGTPLWQPPERYGKHASETYGPDTWPLTEKSDVWAVGLVAHRLLWAGKGEDHFGNSHLKQLNDHVEYRMQSWLETFENTGLTHDLGSFVDKTSRYHLIHNNDLSPMDEDFRVAAYDLTNHESIYSIGLINLIRDCLNYHPDERPDLYTMKSTIDTAISRLDELYGDAIKRPRERTAMGHTVLLEDERWSAFDIGQQYEPPRKRRKVFMDPLTDIVADDYIKHVAKWSDEAQYPRPSPEQQAEAIQAIEDFLNLKRNSHHFDEDPKLRYCFQYLRTCLFQRVAPDAPTHVVTTWHAALPHSFTLSAKKELLRLIRGYVIPRLLEKDDSPIELGDALRVMDHAAQWGGFLLDLGGEHKSPALDDKTELHRGFRDWVMIDPFDKNRVPSESDLHSQ